MGVDLVSEIAKISEEICQFEGLLKLSSQLPDKGDKLKQHLAKLNSDLIDKKNAMKNVVVKEADLAIDFQKLSINKSDDEEESAKENASNTSYESEDSNATLTTVTHKKDAISLLFEQIRDSKESMPNENDLADQPRLINGHLLPHQRRALKWMTWRETQFPNGGILADDMGLGKTLTTISMIAQHIENRDSKLENVVGAKLNGRTLVVCPASVIRQWEDEIHKFTNYALSVCLHHGDNRSTSAEDLTLHEVVLTTYGIVRIEIENYGALSKIHWERIVLDEAHTIRNQSSKQSLCCFRLKGTSKWALTGTPIQNKSSDVFALTKFLQCSPLDDFQMWKRFTKRKAEQRIRSLLKCFLLRRTKHELGQIGEMNSLPEKILEMVSVQLTSDELKVYDTVSSFSKILFEKFRSQRHSNNNAAPSENDEFQENLQKALDFFTISGPISASHILLIILRLRQICIHANLIDAMLMKEDILDISGKTNVLEVLNEVTISGHSDQFLRSNPVFDPQRPSSKFNAILDVIEEKVLKSQEKAVVVSQFTSVLKLFANLLTDRQVKYLTLTGSTKISHRQDIVETFNNSPEEQILLLSLTAGGVGLNLCGANNLFLIDPHWNPQLESQAEDRIYRIGQTKPVTIFRFICKGTIEERIENLQAKKKRLAKNILSGYKLNIDDMMELI